MLTNLAGQEFGQSTMKIVCVRSVISRISTGKTPQLWWTQQLGMESSGGTFTPIFGGWCWLSTETLQVLSSALSRWPGLPASSELQQWVSQSAQGKLHCSFHLAVEIMEYSTGYKRAQAHPDIRRENIDSTSQQEYCQEICRLFFFFFKLPHGSTSFLKGNILSVFTPIPS